MKLRLQLILVSLVMLLLPWAGYQYVVDMEAFMRQSQTLALAATAKAATARLENDERMLENFTYDEQVQGLYASKAPAPLLTDGYDDDWRWVSHNLATDGLNRLQLAHFGQRLYVLFEVIDSQLSYHNPNDFDPINGDHIALQIGGEEFVMRTAAPGGLSAVKKVGDRWQRSGLLRGFWLETETGYRVELELPLTGPETPFAIAAVDSATPAFAQQGRWYGLSDAGKPSLLKFRNHTLESALNDFAGDNLRIIAADRQGWVAADVGSVSLAPPEAEQHGLLTYVYRLVLRNRDVASAPMVSEKIPADIVKAALGNGKATDWFYNQETLVGRAAQVISDDGEPRGVLLVEQSSSDILGATNVAFNRLFLYTFIVCFGALLVLFCYASWLSFRIRRLSIAAQSALTADGNVISALPSVRAGDELGDLARNYQALLAQLQEYTSYLRTLADKLSHELRTPLAVAKSSIENLAATGPTADQQTYIERAQTGLYRLGEMLTAMSAARRLEESLVYSEREEIDFAALLTELVQGYKQTYAAQNITLTKEPTRLLVAPDLVAQMIDKLVDNAIDFCSDDGVVRIALSTREDIAEVVVSNDGPLLPKHMHQQLFESLVSTRTSAKDGKVHMGLGLHIVKLIAEFHGAALGARDRRDGSGVEFFIRFPLP